MSELKVRLLYVTAYAKLHEVVRMHLEGRVNVKYLRKHHAEIERELRMAIEREQERD